MRIILLGWINFHLIRIIKQINAGIPGDPWKNGKVQSMDLLRIFWKLENIAARARRKIKKQLRAKIWKNKMELKFLSYSPWYHPTHRAQKMRYPIIYPYINKTSRYTYSHYIYYILLFCIYYVYTYILYTYIYIGIYTNANI